MKSLKTLTLALTMLALFACEKDGPDIGDIFVSEISNNNAISFIPTIATNTGAKSLFVPIGSAFSGGGIIDPSDRYSLRISFYNGKYSQESEEIMTRSIEPLVEIKGFVYYGVDYTKPGQSIDQIKINGIDESLGLGSRLDIKMNQGCYEGDNELIKDVVIHSFKFASFYDSYHMNKDCDIDIVITTTADVLISIHFVNEETPPDGWI